MMAFPSLMEPPPNIKKACLKRRPYANGSGAVSSKGESRIL